METWELGLEWGLKVQVWYWKSAYETTKDSYLWCVGNAQILIRGSEMSKVTRATWGGISEWTEEVETEVELGKIYGHELFSVYTV